MEQDLRRLPAEKFLQGLLVIRDDHFENRPRAAGNLQGAGRRAGAAAGDGQDQMGRPGVKGLDQAASFGIHAQSMTTFDRSMVACGNLRSIFWSVRTTTSATTRLRYHLWSAGTMCHGAHFVLHRVNASS